MAVAAPGHVLALGPASTSASALVPAWASAPASASAALASAPAVPAAVHNEAAAAAAAAVVPVRARVPSCWGAWAPPGTLGAAPHPACGLTVRAARLLWRFYGACRVHEPILCRTCLLAVGVSVVVVVAASEYWVLGRVPVRWGPQTAGVEPCPLLRQRPRRPPLQARRAQVAWLTGRSCALLREGGADGLVGRLLLPGLAQAQGALPKGETLKKKKQSLRKIIFWQRANRNQKVLSFAFAAQLSHGPFLSQKVTHLGLSLCLAVLGPARVLGLRNEAPPRWKAAAGVVVALGVCGCCRAALLARKHCGEWLALMGAQGAPRRKAPRDVVA